MPDIRTVTDVIAEHMGSDAVPVWRVRSVDRAGHMHEHIFPHVTLAWRAAEYDIDPTDTAALLDIILHEPFLPDLDDPAEAASDPAAAAGLTVRSSAARGGAQPAAEPVRLQNAPSLGAAREAHLLRIAHAKAHRVGVVTPKGKADPLAAIKAARIDPVQVAELAVRVDELRRQYRGERILRGSQALPPAADIPTRQTEEGNRA